MSDTTPAETAATPAAYSAETPIGKLFASGLTSEQAPVTKPETPKEAKAEQPVDKPVEPKAETPKAETPEKSENENLSVLYEDKKPITEEKKESEINTVRPTAKDFRLVKEAKETFERKAKELETEKATLAAKIAELEKAKAEAVPTDYDAVKKQNAELVATMEKLRVEASPTFIREYDAPMQDELTRLKNEVGSVEGFDTEGFIRTVQAPDSKERTEKLNEYLGALNGVQIGKANLRIARFDERREARSSALENHRAWQNEMTQREKQAIVAQEKVARKIMDDVLEDMTKDMPYLKRIEGNAEHNSKVDSDAAAIRSLWTDRNPPEVLARITAQGYFAPTILKHAKSLYAENQELKLKLAEMKKATASVSSGEAPGEVVKSESIFDKFKRGASS